MPSKKQLAREEKLKGYLAAAPLPDPFNLLVNPDATAAALAVHELGATGKTSAPLDRAARVPMSGKDAGSGKVQPPKELEALVENFQRLTVLRPLEQATGDALETARKNLDVKLQTGVSVILNGWILLMAQRHKPGRTKSDGWESRSDSTRPVPNQYGISLKNQQWYSVMQSRKIPDLQAV